MNGIADMTTTKNLLPRASSLEGTEHNHDEKQRQQQNNESGRGHEAGDPLG